MSASEDDDLSPVEDDLIIVEEPENAELVEDNQNADNENQDGEEAEKKEVKTKRVRNPQPKLDSERLKGPRGLLKLKDVFEKVKFKGHGHEEEDLNVLMKNYEYWCHRLFPKFPFGECLERIERLGNKKPMQTYLKRIRMDDILLDEDGVQAQPSVTTNDETEENNLEDTQRTDFDDLFPQASQQPTSISTTRDELTEEQLERIRINRERAQRLRQQMFIRNKETAKGDMLNNSLSNTSINKPVSHETLSQSTNLSDLAETMSINSEPTPNWPESMSVSQSSAEKMSLGSEAFASQMSVSELPQDQTSVTRAMKKQFSTDMSVDSSQVSVMGRKDTGEISTRKMSFSSGAVSSASGNETIASSELDACDTIGSLSSQSQETDDSQDVPSHSVLVETVAEVHNAGVEEDSIDKTINGDDGVFMEVDSS